MKPNRHCYKCGWEWALSGNPGRSDSCFKCSSDLRICLNCIHYDSRAAHNCRERRADPVQEKNSANFCEYFDFARREFAGPLAPGAREDKARADLRKLLGD